jgi:hypothetical protein
LIIHLCVTQEISGLPIFGIAMKTTAFFLVTTVTALFSFGQKLKVKAVELNYLQAPLTPVANMPAEYDFIVEESNMDIKGAMTTVTVLSGSNAYDPRSAFYTGFSGPGRINGFKVVDYQEGTNNTINHIHLKVGILDIASREVMENGSLQGSILPALCYKMQLSVAIEIRLSDPERNEFYYRSTAQGNDKFEYKFPEDYKPTSSLKGYGSTDELESAWQTHRAAFMLEVRDLLVKNWLYETKMDISSHFANQRAQLAVDVYYFKGKGPVYPQVNKAVTNMDSLFAQLSRDSKAGLTSNWHTLYYQEKFAQLYDTWATILSVDTNGNLPFPDEIYAGLYKNQLWCQLFAGNYGVIVHIQQMLSDAGNDYLSMGVDFENIVSFAVDYKKRYDANRAMYSWQ